MMTPLLAMHSLGHAFVPRPIHAGGLRYHGMAPLVSHVMREGLIEALALQQLECYKMALLWAHTEGFIPAPETAHAIAAAAREAARAKEEGKQRTILMNWSGHGLMDLTGYKAFTEGKLVDAALSDSELKKSLSSLEGLPTPPVQYLINYRLSKALELMTRSDRKLEDIASETGFSSVYYFSRLFHKHYHQSPRRYARRIFNAR